MGVIISDKDKLIQDLYKKMTKVTDIYSTTHKVVHWGDVQEIVEKFFMDKNSDWLMAKTEPTISKMEQVEDEPQTCFNCKHNVTKHTFDHACGGCINMNRWEKDEPQKIYCPKCGSSDYIKDLEKDFGVKDDTFKYKCINCNTYIKDEPQISGVVWTDNEMPIYHSTTASSDEPQTDCDTCLYKDAYDEWEGDCDDCQDASNYEPQTEVYDYKGNGKWERNE